MFFNPFRIFKLHINLCNLSFGLVNFVTLYKLKPSEFKPNEPLPDQLLSVLGGVEEEEEEHRGDDMSEMDGPNPGKCACAKNRIIFIFF